jgi:hypothetical protein
MEKLIIYKQDNGIPAVVFLANPDVIIEMASKIVPAGKPYKIIDRSELPTEPQETWIVDEEDLDDGIGEYQNESN